MPIYQLVANQLFHGQETKNVFYYETVSTLDTAQMQEIADGVRGNWLLYDTAIKLVNEWSLQDITLRRVDVPDLPGIDVDFTSGPFIGTGDLTPGVATQVCMLVSGSAPTTKPRRVRSYLAGLPQSLVQQDGAWTLTSRLESEDFIETMDELTITGETLQRVSARFTLIPPRVTSWNRITSYIARQYPATQRRRRPGVGA